MNFTNCIIFRKTIYSASVLGLEDASHPNTLVQSTSAGLVLKKKKI